MKLRYEQLLSPNPINLSFIGFGKPIHLRKPTLRQIDLEITFEKFNVYESFLTLEPEEYFTEILGENGKELWKSFSDEERDSMTLYKIIENDQNVRELYEEMFNFFFRENCIYIDGVFAFLDSKDGNEYNDDSICLVVKDELFYELLAIIRQTCFIKEDDEDQEPPKFKNEIARKLYEKMKKAEKANKSNKKKTKADKNVTIANLISKVSNNHKTISPITVWDLTIFQLIDAFNSMQMSEMYDISKTGVSVWGDKEKQFDASLWFKNNFE